MLFQPLHLFMLAFLAIGGLGTLFWIWMLVECLQDPALDKRAKILWAVGIAVTHVVGAAVYFFWCRSRRLHSASPA
ncbi:MAG TPA: PLDc N-terminal domain-containing protein [Thermoanaerobaculia bacterium]|jgi:hypothetical protein